MFNLEEEENHHDLSSSMTNLSPNITTSGGGMVGKHQTSLPTNKYRSKQPATPTPTAAINAGKFKFPRPVSGSGRFCLFLTFNWNILCRRSLAADTAWILRQWDSYQVQGWINTWET